MYLSRLEDKVVPTMRGERDTGIKRQREGIKRGKRKTKASKPVLLLGPLYRGGFGGGGVEQMECNCTQSVFRAQSLCPPGSIGETLLSH